MSASNMSTARFWNPWSAQYDRVYAYHRADCDAFVALCPSKPALKILDLATGHGWVAEALRSRDLDPSTVVIATDVSPTMVTAARQRFQSANVAISTQVMDAMQPQQLSAILRQYGAFDLITCYWGLGSILTGTGKTTRQLLELWSTLLTPTGRIDVDWDIPGHPFMANISVFQLDSAAVILHRREVSIDDEADWTTVEQAFTAQLRQSPLLAIERTIPQWRGFERDPV